MGLRLLLSSLLLLGGAYLWLAMKIPMDPWTAAETVNSRTMPLIYGVLLCLTLLGLLLRRPTASQPAAAGRIIRVAGLLLITVCFVLALKMISLWLALGLLLAALALWLGERRLPLIFALALSVPLIGWLGIEVSLGLYLPR